MKIFKSFNFIIIILKDDVRTENKTLGKFIRNLNNN